MPEELPAWDYGVTLYVTERRSVPGWVPTETVGTMMLQDIDLYGCNLALNSHLNFIQCLFDIGQINIQFLPDNLPFFTAVTVTQI